MWELIFFLVILKIPIAYLVGVVWYAVRAEPKPLDGAAVTAVLHPEPPHRWYSRRPGSRGPRSGPHGSPVRTPVRAHRAAGAQAWKGQR